MFSHGWDTAPGDAQTLYNTMFPLIRTAAQGVPGLGKLGFAGIYWPSMWFPPTPATAPVQGGSTQASTGAPATLSAGTAAVTGAEIATSLALGFTDAAQQKTITQIGQLIDDGQAMAETGQTDEAKQGQLTQISQLIKSLTPPAPPGGQGEDYGETALLMTEDPADDYQNAAAVFGTPSGDSTEGIGDWFTAAINGAKDALRVLSYWTMKGCAGTIGQTGLDRCCPRCTRSRGGSGCASSGTASAPGLFPMPWPGSTCQPTVRSPPWSCCRERSRTGHSPVPRTTRSAPRGR